MENPGQGAAPGSVSSGSRFKTAVKRVYKRYVLDAMGAMGVGLLASLVIGLILSQLSKIPGLGILAEYSKMVGAASPVVGATVGVAIASALKVSHLSMLASAGAGALGYSMSGPVGAYCASVVAAEVGNLVTGKTKVDIIVVPVVTLATGGLIATWLSPGINAGDHGAAAFYRNGDDLPAGSGWHRDRDDLRTHADRSDLVCGPGGDGVHRARGAGGRAGAPPGRGARPRWAVPATWWASPSPATGTTASAA